MPLSRPAPRATSISLAAMLFAAPLFSNVANAQDYPNKTIRIVTGSAGSGSDIQSRLIAQRISGPLGQPVVVENRASILAAETVSKSPPDGYTIINNGGFWRHKLVQTVPYDGVTDFSPISIISRDVNVIAVHPSVSARTVQELIALARAKPGELNYATGSTGSTGHLAMELFRSMAGINMTWIPHKGSSQAVTALVAGQVQALLLDAGLLVPLGNAGKVRVLAVTSAEPSALAPGFPTVSASGVPGYESVGMTGVFAPARTPDAVIRRLNQEIVRVLRTAEAKDAFFKLGTEVAESTPEQFAAMIRTDLTTMTKLVRDLNIKPE